MRRTRITTRSWGRTLQFSFSRPRRVTTYVRPPHLRRSVIGVKQALAGLAAVAALQFAHPPALAAGPQIEGTVTSGQLGYGNLAPITRPDATTANVNQATPKVVMDLTTLVVPQKNTLNFNQQGHRDWLFVGRGVGNKPFENYGTINADGQLFLTNPQGVIFAPGSSVNLGGLVATTLDIRKEDVEAGRYVFRNNGATGEVKNQGTIYAPSGYAALIGPKVSNEGFIRARTAALVAGNRVALDMIGDNLINLRVEQAAVGALALNKGTIQADGGTVWLMARSADALLDTVVNNTGIIRATSLVERNGVIVLDGGSAGVVANSGTLDVSGTAAGATGGTVKVLGEHVALADGTRINASGDTGGGTVLVGGNFHGAGPEQNATTAFVGAGASIDASAINSGNGGNVAVWSDGSTSVHGSIAARGGSQSGNGGLVETSGKAGLDVRGARIDTRAPNGSTGNWLLDPDDVNVVHDAGASTGGAFDGGTPNTFTPTTTATVTDSDINTNLATTNVKVTTTSGNAGNGDITFDASAGQIVLTSAGNSLTFDATRN